MKDIDHGTIKGLLRSRQTLDATDAFLHEVKTFEIASVKAAFEKARKHCRALAQDLFDADLALQLRAKGPPAGPLFEQEAQEQSAADQAELERRALADAPAPDVTPTPEKKKRGRPRKERAPESEKSAPPEVLVAGSPNDPMRERIGAPLESGTPGITYELRRDPQLGGATYACRLVASTNGTLSVLTGLSRPIEPRQLLAMTPENLPSLVYDEHPELLGWAAGQLKAIPPEEG